MQATVPKGIVKGSLPSLAFGGYIVKALRFDIPGDKGPIYCMVVGMNGTVAFDGSPHRLRRRTDPTSTASASGVRSDTEEGIETRWSRSPLLRGFSARYPAACRISCTRSRASRACR
jgi:hypothetical protein